MPIDVTRSSRHAMPATRPAAITGSTRLFGLQYCCPITAPRIMIPSTAGRCRSHGGSPRPIARQAPRRAPARPRGGFPEDPVIVPVLHQAEAFPHEEGQVEPAVPPFLQFHLADAGPV